MTKGGRSKLCKSLPATAQALGLPLTLRLLPDFPHLTLHAYTTTAFALTFLYSAHPGWFPTTWKPYILVFCLLSDPFIISHGIAITPSHLLLGWRGVEEKPSHTNDNCVCLPLLAPQQLKPWHFLDRPYFVLLKFPSSCWPSSQSKRLIVGLNSSLQKALLPLSLL